MKTGTKWLIGVIALILILIFVGIGFYNNLVTSEQQVDAAKANIDTQLQRRSDLIPNLVSTVQGYASQEKEIFSEIATARTQLAGATNVTEQADANNALSSALSRLLLIVENYPDLKSNQNFRDLSVQLEGCENRIAIARQDYNTAVTKYNTTRRRFPNNIIAGLFGFEPKTLFEASSGAQEVPTVDFNR